MKINVYLKTNVFLRWISHKSMAILQISVFRQPRCAGSEPQEVQYKVNKLQFKHSWKWNESGFRPPLCTNRLNWARRTSWGWWDDWDDTVHQTQDSKFEPWRSEAEHATSRSRRLLTILTFTRGWGRNIFCFFQTAETGNRTPNCGMKCSCANHYPRGPALKHSWIQT